MKKTFALLLSLAALATSCKKDDTPTTAGPSAKVGMLTAKRWGLTAATAQQGTMTTDAFANMAACEKDNFLRFNADRTVEANEGATKCDPTDPTTQMGTWDLVSNESKLMLTTPLFGSGTAAVLDIVSLTETRMQLRGSVIDPDTRMMSTLTATMTAL